MKVYHPESIKEKTDMFNVCKNKKISSGLKQNKTPWQSPIINHKNSEKNFSNSYPRPKAVFI